MKKLMIVAAAAAMTAAANASIAWQVCEECGASGDNADCPAVVFKVTGSGKAVTPKSEYKTVSTLKIKKGGLALIGELCETTGDCCYSTGTLYAKVKAGKSKFGVMANVNVDVWSVFGKNLEKARNWGSQIKQGKKVKLESALFISSADDFVVTPADTDLGALNFWASAFGKVTFKVNKATKGSSSYCDPSDSPCEPTIKPGNYKGWFVGTYACVGDENCFLCDCVDTDVFGGTWKAKYQKKLTTQSQAAALSGYSLSSFDADAE